MQHGYVQSPDHATWDVKDSLVFSGCVTYRLTTILN